VPSWDSTEPLAPDACRSDPSAPCFYWHTKLQALNGGWGKLTPEERRFVGVEVNEHVRPPAAAASGWRSPLAIAIDKLGASVTPAEVAMLERLMGQDTPPRDRLDFLGG
jgi:hypothetical protein